MQEGRRNELQILPPASPGPSPFSAEGLALSCSTGNLPFVALSPNHLPDMSAVPSISEATLFPSQLLNTGRQMF